MPTRPATKQTTEIQQPYLLGGGRMHERQGHVEAMRQQHDYGMFSTSASFVDELLSDDRIAGVFDQRLAAVLAKTVNFTPAGPRRKDKKVSERWGGNSETESAGMWSECVSIAAQREMLKWGLMLGVAVGQLVWRRTVKEWRPRLIPWHGQHVRWDWQRRRFIVRTKHFNDIVLPDPDEQPRGDGQWVVWCPYGYENGWLNGLVRKVGDLYIDRRWNRRDWNRHDEVHGQPTFTIKHPPAEGEDLTKVIGQFENMGSQTVAFLPQPADKDERGWDMALIESTGKGWETFLNHKEAIDTDIAVLILGQNLTTEVQEGSFAAAKVHGGVADDKVVIDAQLFPVLREQVLTWDALYNHGDADLAPFVHAMVEVPEDEGQEAATLEKIGNACTALWTADSRVDVAAILERYGIPMRTEAEAAEAEEVAEDDGTPPAPPTDGGGAPAGGDPDNGEDESKRTKQQANRVALSAAKRTVAGNKRAAEYEDQLTKSAQKRGSKAMSAHLDLVVREVKAAASPEDLKRRLVKLLRDKLRPDEMGEVLRKAAVLSNLFGRERALTEV